MKATYVAPLLTKPEPADIALDYTMVLGEMTGAVPKPAGVAVLLAQYALETGNGAACYNWNLGNIKAGTEWEGLYTCIRLNERLKQDDGSYAYVWFSPEGEERPKGNVLRTHTVPPGHPQTRMRAHEELRDGVRKKIEFLLKPHWRPALDIALTGDAMFYVAKVRQLGYFTAELGPYQRAVVSLAKKWLPVAEGAQDGPEGIEDDAQLCADMAECVRAPLPPWLLARVNVHVATLGVDWDEQRRARDASMRSEADTEPSMPEVHTGDTEPPGAA